LDTALVALLDDVLPEFDFVEQHEVRAAAAGDELLAAARAVTLRELPLVRLLFRLRGLGRRTPHGTVLGAMAEEGFETVAEEPGRELVLGAVGRPWTPRGGIRRDVDFRRFAEPGWARMAMSLSAVDGRLRTETRVALTDARSRRRFRLYWLAVRPFSGLVRRRWLRAAARRAVDVAGEV
jgi:hypothetical protein